MVLSYCMYGMSIICMILCCLWICLTMYHCLYYLRCFFDGDLVVREGDFTSIYSTSSSSSPSMCFFLVCRLFPLVLFPFQNTIHCIKTNSDTPYLFVFTCSAGCCLSFFLPPMNKPIQFCLF
jgi:hypothetical protein